jgi:monoamine oxidase
VSDGKLATRVYDDPSAINAKGSHFDVLIIGAGLSGIGAACHLVRKRPKTTFAILEARDAIGGTWYLFRYPGIRSDSDMSTFGCAFRPWDDSKAIADGPSILRYLVETAKAYSVDRHIRFGLEVVRASWRSRTLAGRSTSMAPTARSSDSLATSSSCAQATTSMRRATRQTGQARRSSLAASCIRRSGLTTCVATASGSS